MVYRTFKFMVTLIEDQSSGKLSTQSKLTIATAIFGIAILFFGIAYGVSYLSATSIKNVKKERDEILSEMIRINMGELPKSPSEVRLKLVNELDEIKGNVDSVNALIDKYTTPHKENFNEISRKIQQNPSTDIHTFINKEKEIVTAEILEIDKKINAINLDVKAIDEKINEFLPQTISTQSSSSNDVNLNRDINNQLYGKKINELIKKYYNNDNNKINDFKNDFDLYRDDKSRSMADFILNFKAFSESDSSIGLYKYNDLLLDLKSEVAKIDKEYNKLLNDKVQQFDELQKLYKNRDLKNKNNLSLDTYKKNKAYIFHNQYKISKLSVDYCIEKAIKFYAFHKAIVYSLLVFTTIISLCAFVISKQGWTQTPKIIQIVSVCVLVIIGMLNLMSVVLKPKANYDTYIAKAELNENVQSDIVLFFNKYDKLKETQIDSLILKNFSKITKFSEILPETNDKGISKDIFEFKNILTEKTE